MVIIELVRGVDADQYGKSPRRAVYFPEIHLELLPWRQRSQALKIEAFRPVETYAAIALAGLELQGENPHADQIGPVNPLEAFGYHGANSEKFGPFCRPVARGTCAVFLAGYDD